MTSQEILRFWFQELNQVQWFKKDEQVDELIRKKFLETHERASRCEFDHWRSDIHGRLAEIIVLDQFSRNLFRNHPKAFAQDPLALALAQEALRTGEVKKLTQTEKAFLFMPFMHSESPAIHEKALQLFNEPGLESNYEYEILHKKIIDRFGRYPHRNTILGRTSTPEEIEFLKEPGSSF